jgi:hypothetical protein
MEEWPADKKRIVEYYIEVDREIVARKVTGLEKFASGRLMLFVVAIPLLEAQNILDSHSLYKY